MVRRVVPEYIRSENGPEFTAKRVRDWIKKIGTKTLFIEPGSPRENGYNESFKGGLNPYILALGISHDLSDTTNGPESMGP